MTALDPRVYRDAASTIRSGWCQGDEVVKQGDVVVARCAVHALWVAQLEHADTYKRHEEYAAFACWVAGVPRDLSGPYDVYIIGLAKFNDAPTTTAEDVASLFDTCAEKLEADE